MYLYTDPCLIDYYNDGEFLHTDCKETPTAWVCTKACDLVCRVLLFLNAVVLCSGGTADCPPRRSGWMDHRFREISFGRPGG